MFRLGLPATIFLAAEATLWLLCCGGQSSSNFSFADVLLFDIILRVGCVVAVLFHEWCHLLTAVVLTQCAANLLTCENLLANLSVEQYGIFLIPFVGRPFDHSPYVKIDAHLVKKGSLKDNLIALSGPVASFALLYYLLNHVSCWFETIYIKVAVLASAAAVSITSLSSDVYALPIFGQGRAPFDGWYGCGNWGLLMPRSFLDSFNIDPDADSDDDDSEMSSYSKSATTKKSVTDNSVFGMFPKMCEYILRSVLDLVELRGAQAGGVATMVRDKKGDVTHIRSRAVKPKRGYLADEIFNGFRKCLGGSFDESFPVLAQGHSRFGTSSAPAVAETHPHQWEAPSTVDVWKRNPTTQKWEKHDRVTWSVIITHNGDFDAWAPYGQMVPNSAMGTFLKHALHCENTARGDSPKFAGIMDLITTQGVWSKSLRMAFVLNTLEHVDEITNWDPNGNTIVPPPSIFEEWGRVIDHCMEQRIASGESLQFDPEINEKAFQNTVSVFLTALKQHHSFNDAVLPMHINSMMESAIHNFLYQDPYTATRMFFDNAMGTFGCSVTCTAWPSLVILAAKGQPISVGFDTSGQSCVWSSEMSGLRCAKVNGKSCVRFRVDMADATGEMLQISLPNSSNGEENNVYSALDEESFRPVLGSCFAVRGERLNEPAGQGWLDGVEWAERLLDMKYEQIGLKSFPTKDVIQYDIDSIPAVVEEIDACWSTVTSLNFQSGTNFANLIKKKVNMQTENLQPQDNVNGQDDDAVASRPLDVLCIGVENSLWIAQQFVADLARLCPHLKIMALSSNWVLGALQSEAGHMESLNFAINKDNFKISPQTICLSVSQSGTTYPTVWASRLIRVHTPNIFALSGDFDSLLSNAIGQFPNDQDFSQRVFSTLSGVRPAEPSTVATIAMHHTLTWLLVTIANSLSSSSATTNTIKSTNANSSSISSNNSSKKAKNNQFIPPKSEMKLLARSLAPAARLLTGKDGAGNAVDSKINMEIKDMGRRWGYHLSEPYWALVLTVLYIFVTVCTGYGVVSAIYKNIILPHIIMKVTDVFENKDDLYVKSTSSTNINGQTVEQVSYQPVEGYDDESYSYWWFAPFPYPIFTFLAHFADATIYCFLGALTSLGLRWWQGRRLMTRYTARSVLIVDSTMVYKLMRAYLSKLKALSWRFTTFGVAGQNAMDHFVHEYTHLTTSEVLVAAGRPDGRLASLASAESAVMMSLMQAKFIKQNKTGIEVLSIGHNPWNRADMCRLHVVLPTVRPASCTEQILYGKETDYALNPIAPAAVVAKVEELKTQNSIKNPSSNQNLIKQSSKFSFSHRNLISNKVEELYHNKSSAGADDVTTAVSNTITTQEDVSKTISRKKAVQMVYDALLLQQTQLKIDVATLPLDTLWDENSDENIQEISISQVLAVLRGDRLKEMMDGQRLEQRKREFVAENSASQRRMDLIAKVFDGWRDAISETLIQNQLAKLEESARAQIMGNLATVQNINPDAAGINIEADSPGSPSPVMSQTTSAAAPAPVNRRRSIAVSMPPTGLDTAAPQTSTVKQGGRMSVRCSISGMGILSMVDLQTPPGLWRSAEARRRCLFRMDTAHKISTMGRFFQTWREASSIESVDVRLAKSVRHEKLKLRRRYINSIKDSVSRVTSHVKDKISLISRDSVNSDSRSTYTPRNDSSAAMMSGGPREALIDVGGGVGGKSSHASAAQEVVLGYDSLKKHASSTKNLLGEVQISELFYETRIAAAERMISFMILFHEMVKPLSKVPLIGFDMDRTESRLRVASTPAPVAMHEKLPACKWQQDCCDDSPIGA